MVSLGCAKNLVDAEVMLGTLQKAGFEIVPHETPSDALIVNTCSFIEAAQEESVDTILESAAVRDARLQGQALVVAGCLTQRFREELPGLLPEVDAFMGIDEVPRVGEIVQQALNRRAARPTPADSTPSMATSARRRPRPVPVAPAIVQVSRRPRYVPDYASPRFRLTPAHTAYVKIAEGCNHPCSFCTIPSMRGSHRSRPLDDIVREAEHLLSQGVRELNLISQDSTYYGLDLRPRRDRAIAAPEPFRAAARVLPAGHPTLSALLRALNALPGDFWIRLLYTHPAHWTEELIETLASCRKVARYVDMPLQHIHDNLLQRMRRETSRQHIVELIARFRRDLPDMALRTTFIVGFPGETDACFQALREFIRETRFERLGVFTYSREGSTRAARMRDQIDACTMQRRRDQVLELQQSISREIAAGRVGQVLPVLVERTTTAARAPLAEVAFPEHGQVRQPDSSALPGRAIFSVARSEADAPGIDGRVYVRGRLPIGAFARVRVIGHTDYDLVAVPETK